jgi:leader peptidase (prepilin peptidase) / N-methyltransferase
VMRALVIGALLGGVAALVLLATRRAGLKSTSAYAPYLALGAMITLWTTLGA